eukprot:4398994-Amphidinium_carterae.2
MDPQGSLSAKARSPLLHQSNAECGSSGNADTSTIVSVEVHTCSLTLMACTALGCRHSYSMRLPAKTLLSLQFPGRCPCP